MADFAGDLDKTEPATAFKLEEARRKGQVFKSPELVSMAILSVALVVLLAFGEWSIRQTMSLSSQLLVEAGRQELTPHYVFQLLLWMSQKALYILSPLLALALIGGVLANVIQTGVVFSAFPLKPDFSRINPAQGFKRVFSMRSLYEGLKSLIKLALVSGILYAVLMSLVPSLMGLIQRPVSSYPAYLASKAAFVLFVLLLGFLAMSLADLIYSKWEYGKKMRMSRRELKDEHRRREGDPQIRQKRRELQRSMRKKANSLGRVKDADVLITNPTHLAIALQYKRGEMRAPKLIAKGAGGLALKMREEAFRYGVTVVESPVLARKLFDEVDFEEMIPEDTYADVAAILRRILLPKAAQETGA
jgi:flagellar biosynthetic protein FlhB